MPERSEPVFYVLLTREGSTTDERVDLTDRVIDFSYEDDEKKADVLRLRVRNWDLSNFDDPTWKQGNKLLVSWGYVGDMAPARSATIQKVTGFQELAVEAQGEEAQMNKVTRTRSFLNVTRAEVARRVAVEHGFDPGDLDVEDTEVRCEVVTQARETDAQFLRRLATMEGFEFFADLDGMHFHQRRLGQPPRYVFTYYTPPGVGDVIKANVANDVFGKPQDKAGKTTLRARDPETKTDLSATGSDGSTDRDKLAPVSVVVDPVTGAVNQRAEAPAPGPAAASEDARPTTQTDPRLVKREADGAYKTQQLRAVELDLELVGVPGLRAKTVVEVRGMGKTLSGLYYVKRVTSKLGSGGFTQAVKLASDGTQGLSVRGGLTTQTVEQCREKLDAARAALAVLESTPGADPENVRLGRNSVSALEKQCAQLEAAQSRGKTNEKKATAIDDPGRVEEQVVVDPVTGEAAVVYGKPRGGGTETK